MIMVGGIGWGKGRRLVLGDEADVAGQDDAAARELPHVANPEPGARDGAQEAGQGLVVEANPPDGRKCRWGKAVWKHGRRVSAERYRGRAGRVLAGHAGLVRRGVRRADAGPGGGLA